MVESRNYFVIEKNYKPRFKNSDGSYRRTYLARAFPSRELAEDYLHMMWGCIAKDKPGKRFVSASVVPMKMTKTG
jgi:hypothetical protein